MQVKMQGARRALSSRKNSCGDQIVLPARQCKILGIKLRYSHVGQRRCSLKPLSGAQRIPLQPATRYRSSCIDALTAVSNCGAHDAQDSGEACNCCPPTQRIVFEYLHPVSWLIQCHMSCMLLGDNSEEYIKGLKKKCNHVSSYTGEIGVIRRPGKPRHNSTPATTLHFVVLIWVP